MNPIFTLLSNIILLLFVVGIPAYGAYKKVAVFDTFVEGAQEGFQLCIRLLPYLVGILVSIGMLRASGFFNLMGQALSPILGPLGIPSELIPLSIIRPFSGSASLAILNELCQQYGGNSLIAQTAATMLGSTETTFYVIAIYFGAVGIRNTRHAIPAGLLADLTGVLVSIAVCHYLL
ncbi:MAG: spore maturation protein [Legionellaceae bacterium]|nr:spore maturation protein [Legionellaceae bacterium]